MCISNRQQRGKKQGTKQGECFGIKKGEKEEEEEKTSPFDKVKSCYKPDCCILFLSGCCCVALEMDRVHRDRLDFYCVDT